MIAAKDKLKHFLVLKCTIPHNLGYFPHNFVLLINVHLGVLSSAFDSRVLIGDLGLEPFLLIILKQ